jgi:hypothetical protein
VDSASLHVSGTTNIVSCHGRNAGGIAVKNGAVLLRDFVNLTSCRARENGGGIMTFGGSEVSVTGKVATHKCMHAIHTPQKT